MNKTLISNDNSEIQKLSDNLIKENQLDRNRKFNNLSFRKKSNLSEVKYYV